MKKNHPKQLQLEQPLLDHQQPITSYQGSRTDYPTLDRRKEDKLEDTYPGIQLTVVETKTEDATVEIKTNDLSDHSAFDFDLNRKTTIRETIETKCKAFKAKLAVLAAQENGEVYAQISKKIRWDQIEAALITLHTGKGQHMGDPDRQQAKEAIMTAFGKASQCDEGLFTLLNLITAVKGLLKAFGDTKVLRGIFWTIISIIAVYGAFSDIFGINPAKQAKNNISPDFEFEIQEFRSIDHAKFYLHVLNLHEEIFETPMKPWKKNLGALTLGIASTGGLYVLGQRYLSSYIEETSKQASWPIVLTSSATASSLLTLSTYKGLTLSALQVVSEPVNWLSFVYTNGLGAIAQLIPIAELYNTQITPDNYSRGLKLTLGLTFWAIVYWYSLCDSKMGPHKKHFFAVLWAILCASLVLENPSPGTLQFLSTAWTLGFFIPVGVSYYIFLSGLASDYWGKFFWTKKNIIYQLFKISFWLGAENLIQLLSNCGRRSGAFSGLIADYLLLAYLVEKCPSWVMWPTIAITLISSIFTRMAGLPILSTFQYTDPFGQTSTIPHVRLLEFEINGSPAMEQAQLPSSTKREQVLLSTVFGLFLGSGIGLLTSSPTINPLISVAVAAGSVAALGGINYAGQYLSRRAEIARKIIDDAILIPNNDEKKAMASTERLKKGGRKFAVSSVFSNAIMRILSSAFLIAGFGLINAQAGNLDTFTTVWLAVLFLATAPAVNEARVTLNAEALPTAIKWLEGSEDSLLAAREGYDLLLVSKHDPVKHKKITGDAVILSDDNKARFTIGGEVYLGQDNKPFEAKLEVDRDELKVCSSEEPKKYKILKSIKDEIITQSTTFAGLPLMPTQSCGTKVILTLSRAFYCTFGGQSIFCGKLPPPGIFYAENAPEIKDKNNEGQVVVELKQPPPSKQELKHEPTSPSLTYLPYRAETPAPMREADLQEKLQAAIKQKSALLEQMKKQKSSGQKTSWHQRQELNALKDEIRIYTLELQPPISTSTITLISSNSSTSSRRNSNSHQNQSHQTGDRRNSRS